MATDLERLVVQLEANTRRFEREMARARQTANKELSAIERRAKQTNANLSKNLGGGLGGLGRFAGAAGVGLAANEVRKYADAWTSAGNRIKAAEQISGKQARSLSDLNKIASETRSGISETAELYAKLLTSTKDVAKSELEVAQATEIVNKAFKAGGASASEQAAGVLQLSQALGSGLLQGDELRSLRENAPLLAQAIADEFGTTIGGLKDLGAEGALTIDRVFKAILGGGKKIDAAFKATTATIGDGLTELGNAATEFIGTLSEITGLSGGAQSGLSQLAEAIRAVSAAMKEGASTEVGQAFIRTLQTYARVLSGVATIDLVKSLANDAAEISDVRQQLAGMFAEYRKGLAAIKPSSLSAFDDLAAKIDAGTISADDAKKALEAIAGTDARLQQLPRAFDPLISKLGEVVAAAEKAAAAVGGVVGQSFRQSELASMDKLGSLNAERDKFLSDRTSEAARSDAQKEIDARTKDVMEAAEKAGLALTEAAARIQAAGEIAAENATKAGAASVSSTAELIKRFEGFISTPKFDVNAFRAGFGSDTVTLSDGSVQRVTQGISVSLADANRDLERRIGEFQKTIEGQIGSNTFRGMNENQQAALTSIAYNYGSLPQRIVEAIKTGNVETVTNAIRGLGGDNGGINRRRRNEEADIFLSGAPEGLQEDIALRQQQQDLIQQTIASLQQESAAIAQETGLIGASNAEKERARLVTETLNELARQGIEITPQLREMVEAEANARYQAVSAYDAQAEAAARLQQSQEELAAVQQEVNSAFQGALKSFITDLSHGKSLTEALTSALTRLADRLIDIGLDQLFSSLGGGGGIGGFLGGLFGGFAGGGYTGNGGTREPAGVVHGKEFVVNANATRKNRALLEAINGGMPGYADGGFVLPRVNRAPAASGRSRSGDMHVSMTVVTPDAPSFLESQNQIANKTAAMLERTMRTR